MNGKTRWRLAFSVIGIAQPLAALFPVAWVLRWLKGFNPLWIVLDDTRKNPDGTLAEDYRIYLKRIKKPWGVFTWHVFRNRVWNLVESFPVEDGSPSVGNQDIVITKVIKDNLYKKDGTKVPIGGPYVASAGLKFVGDPGDSPWQVNDGEVISEEHSILGEAEFYFTAGGKEYWRKTSCKVERVWWKFGKKNWVTRFRGTNSSRHSFKQKYQSLKPWGKWA